MTQLWLHDTSVIEGVPPCQWSAESLPGVVIFSYTERLQETGYCCRRDLLNLCVTLLITMQIVTGNMNAGSQTCIYVLFIISTVVCFMIRLSFFRASARGSHHFTTWSEYIKHLALSLFSPSLILATVLLLPHRLQKADSGVKRKASRYISFNWKNKRVGARVTAGAVVFPLAYLHLLNSDCTQQI